jgi:hypothetical protein
MAQDKDQWQTLVNTVLTPLPPAILRSDWVKILEILSGLPFFALLSRGNYNAKNIDPLTGSDLVYRTSERAAALAV